MSPRYPDWGAEPCVTGPGWTVAPPATASTTVLEPQRDTSPIPHTPAADGRSASPDRPSAARWTRRGSVRVEVGLGDDTVHAHSPVDDLGDAKVGRGREVRIGDGAVHAQVVL